MVGDRDKPANGRVPVALPRPRPVHGAPDQGPDGDIVVNAAIPGKATPAALRVLGDKTQGCPYPFWPCSAAAMLVEERFPRHAMVRGDIDRGQARKPAGWPRPSLAASYGFLCASMPRGLSSACVLPTLPARCRARSSVFLEEAGEQHEAMLRAFPGEDGAREWQRALAECKSPASLSAVRLVIAWLNAGRGLP